MVNFFLVFSAKSEILKTLLEWFFALGALGQVVLAEAISE